MRIAICDDEEDVRHILRRKVTGLFPTDTVDVFSCGQELLDAKKQPDILLLDIKLPGISGMETARRLREKNDRCMLIFITGEEGFVFDSFDVGAFHYLVKPFSEDKLRDVLKRAKKTYLKDSGRAEKRYTMITSGGTHIRLCLDEMIYAEVFNSKVIVHLRDGHIEYYGKLTELEMAAGEDFFRTHRSFLVNLGSVKSYNANEVVLSTGLALVSKRNYPSFVKALMDYNMRKGYFS